MVRTSMIPIDLSGKVALVTGVGDNESFAWFIAKALNAAGAKIVLASHPRMVGIVESILGRAQDAVLLELLQTGHWSKFLSAWWTKAPPPGRTCVPAEIP